MTSGLKTLLRNPRLWFWAAVFVFLYLDLFVLPNVPIWMRGDNSVYLLNATRMSEGQVMYRDFFHFVPPGTELVYRLFFVVFGIRSWIPNLLLIVLGVALTWVITWISKQIVPGKAAFLPGLVFLTFVYRRAFDGTHHWCSTLAVMAALAVVLTDRTYPRLAISGFLCGLASCFTQTTGAVTIIGLVFYVLWERKRQGAPWREFCKRAILLFGVFLSTVVVAFATFSRSVGWHRFFESTIVFVIRYYPKDLRWNTLRVYMTEAPSIHPWYHVPAFAAYLFVHAIIPLVFVLFIVRYSRLAGADWQEPWEKLVLLNFVGLAMFVSIIPAPGWVRLGTVSLPALILLTWFLKGPGRLCRVFRMSLWGFALALAIGEPLTTQVHQHYLLDAPRGSAAFMSSAEYNKFRWLQGRTQPGEFLFEADFPDVYYLLGLRDPGRVPFVTPTGYTRPEQVQQTIEALEQKHVRLVVWGANLDIPYENRREGDHLNPLRKYLREHYRASMSFELEQVWVRRE